MSTSSQTRFTLFTLATTLVLATLLSAAPAPAQQATGQKPGQQAASQGGKTGPTMRRGAAAPRIWWNQPRFVEGLGLSTEQRTQMNASFTQHLAMRRDKAQTYQGLRGDFGQAVARGDWSGAEKVEEQMTELAAELARIDSHLVIDVARLLSDAQRAKLQSDFPTILRRPWLLGGMGMNGAKTGERFRGKKQATKGSRAPKGEAKGSGGA